MKLRSTACIEAPKDKVWEVLSDIANIHMWVAPIASAKCVGAQTTGVGTVRVCELGANIQVKEDFTEWHEGYSFTYQACNAPMIKFAKNSWSIQAVNGKTLLTSEAEVTLKGGMFGKLLLPFMYLWSKKLGADSLAAFKYLVEEGHAYTGKASRLPRVISVC